MVATRRSSQRLQEKVASAPTSPAGANDSSSSHSSTPTRGTTRKAGSATKKSPSTGSATKTKTPPKRGVKKDDEVTKKLFQAEATTTESQQTAAESVSEQESSEEVAEVANDEPAASMEGEDSKPVETAAAAVEQSRATEDNDEEEEEELLLMDSEDDGEDADANDANADEAEDEDEEEMDISAYVMMAASGINLSTTKSSSLTSGSSSLSKASSRIHLVPDALDSGASQHATYFEFQGRKCANGAKLVADKRTQEEQATLQTQLQVAAHSTRQREEHQNKKSAGRKWFDMESEELTPEVRRDFALLRMRNYLDPKKFYKTSDHHKKLPKHFQMGVVIEGAHEFKSARLTKKQRHQTFTEEIMADTGIQTYTKRVFGQIQASRSGQGKKKMKKTKTSRY